MLENRIICQCFFLITQSSIICRRGLGTTCLHFFCCILNISFVTLTFHLLTYWKRAILKSSKTYRKISRTLKLDRKLLQKFMFIFLPILWSFRGVEEIIRNRPFCSRISLGKSIFFFKISDNHKISKHSQGYQKGILYRKSIYHYG